MGPAKAGRLGPEPPLTPHGPLHLLAPVDRPGEPAALLAAGARWLYGGALPTEWVGRYPALVPLNQRTFASAQFSSVAELAAAIDETRTGGGRFALTLNAPFYTGDQLPLALDLAAFAARTGAEAVIAGDPGLIRALRESGLPLAIHLSVMGMAGNPAALAFYRRLGVVRVILPRHLRIGEISALAAASSGVELEAFLLVGKCPNVEGACSFLHDSPGQRWPCEWPFVPGFADGSPLPPGLAEGCRAPTREERRDACGLCAVPLLAASGVTGFKVVGRGAPTARKVSLVAAAARALAAVQEGQAGSAAWRRECRGASRRLFGHGCTPLSCYYPELWESP